MSEKFRQKILRGGGYEMSRNFARKIENFICENCGYEVIGNGYTSHCPKCLYSKHVDVNPGDRSCICRGLMKPISVSVQRDEYVIAFKCKKCGVIKRCKSSENDDFNAILSVIRKGGGCSHV